MKMIPKEIEKINENDNENEKSRKYIFNALTEKMVKEILLLKVLKKQMIMILF